MDTADPPAADMAVDPAADMADPPAADTAVDPAAATAAVLVVDTTAKNLVNKTPFPVLYLYSYCSSILPDVAENALKRCNGYAK